MVNRNLLIRYIMGLPILFLIAFIIIKTTNEASDKMIGIIIIYFPMLTFIASLILQLLIRRKIIILSVILIGYLVATFVLYNISFLVWCFVYTIVALIGTLIADLILKCKKSISA